MEKSTPTIEEARALIEEHGSMTAASKAIGRGKNYIEKFLKRTQPPHVTADGNTETDRDDGPERDIETLLHDRESEFQRHERSDKARQLRKIKIADSLPIAIVHVGDPHIDDPGVSVREIERDLSRIRETPGMYAATVGDISNNWVGRLAALYGGQSTTEAEAWKLVDWFFSVCQGHWLFVVGGNHCYWSGARDLLKMITHRRGTAFQYHGARFELEFKNGFKHRVNCRHDFKGSSIWNPAHGSMKAAQKGSFRDHVYTCGHKHHNAYGLVSGYGSDGTAIVSHCMMVSGYKRYDSFAKQIGAEETPKAPCAVTVIDPHQQNPYEQTRVFWDVEEGALFLEWLRKRRAKA